MLDGFDHLPLVLVVRKSFDVLCMARYGATIASIHAEEFARVVIRKSYIAYSGEVMYWSEFIGSQCMF